MKSNEYILNIIKLAFAITTSIIIEKWELLLDHWEMGILFR